MLLESLNIPVTCNPLTLHKLKHLNIQIPPDHRICGSHIMQYCCGYCSQSTIEGTLMVLHVRYSCHSIVRVPSMVLKLAVATVELRNIRST